MTDTPTPPPPADPWAGQDGHTYTLGMASIPQRIEPAPVEPQVVYVERPRRRRWPWLMGVLAVLTLGCCGVLATVTEPMRAQHPVCVELHDRIAGLDRDTSPAVQREVDKLIVDIHAQQDVVDAEVAKLDDPADKNKYVVLVVATRFVLDPSSELDKAIVTLGMEKPTGVRSYDAGSRGGYLRCGNTVDKDSDAKVVVCAWTDHGSLGFGLFYGARSMDDSAALLRKIRDEILAKA